MDTDPSTIKTYVLSEDGKAITCLGCNRTSYNHHDISRLYCGHCQLFHEDLWPPAREWFITQGRKRAEEAVSALALQMGFDTGVILIRANEGGDPWDKILDECIKMVTPREVATEAEREYKDGLLKRLRETREQLKQHNKDNAKEEKADS